MSFVSNLKQRLGMSTYPRRWTTAERREIQRQTANDPEVDRALRKMLAERPELRESPSNSRDLDP